MQIYTRYQIQLLPLGSVIFITNSQHTKKNLLFCISLKLRKKSINVYRNITLSQQNSIRKRNFCNPTYHKNLLTAPLIGVTYKPSKKQFETFVALGFYMRRVLSLFFHLPPHLFCAAWKSFSVSKNFPCRDHSTDVLYLYVESY